MYKFEQNKYESFLYYLNNDLEYLEAHQNNEARRVASSLNYVYHAFKFADVGIYFETEIMYNKHNEYYREVYDFLLQFKKNGLYTNRENSFPVFDFYEEVYEIYLLARNSDTQRIRKNFEKANEKLKILGTDQVLKCFVETYRHIYDPTESVWKKYRLKTLFL